MPGAGDYRERGVPAALAHALECLWTRSVTARSGAPPHVVVPDNCADVILELSPDGDIARAYVVGTMTRPLPVKARPGAYIGLRFRPGWLAPVLGVTGRALRDLRVDLCDLAPSWLEALQGNAWKGDPSAGLLWQAGSALERSGAPHPDVRLAVDHITRTGGTIPIGCLCRDLGVSRQHLARQFDDALGVSPKFCSRVVRMQRVLSARGRIGWGGWAAAAHENGYCDQSHLVADFRALVGSTPTGLPA